MGSALTLERGSLFARDFRIERPLAEGGMGAVYVAYQLSTGRLRALKVMQPELVQNDDLRRRFVLEAKVGASIASEHVVEVQVAGIDEQTGAPFLVMELLDGVDLATYLEQHGPLSLEELRELFRQMCHALQRAHEAGIVHRDLKPANVFLAAPKRATEGRFHVKVLDFGIAKMTRDATAGAAQTGMIGTPLWMAPEQADHVPVTPAADVWALGLMLYTASTGKSFWRNGNAEGVSLQHIFREMLFDPIPSAIVRAEEQGATLPAALASVIGRSVIRRPAERLRDAGAFHIALEQALAGKAPPEPTTTTFGGALLEAPDFETPSLELALAPSRAISRAAGPSPTAATIAPPLPRAAEPPLPPLSAPRGPALLDRGSRMPWWLVYVVPLAVVAAFALAVRSRLRDQTPNVECRLCTVETGTFANGTIPLGDLRHDIEERFPELDTLCVKNASGAGRAKLRWVVDGGDAKGATVTGGGSAGMCLLTAITRRQFPILVGAAGFGHTEITFIVEWDPARPAPWPPR